MKKRMLSVLLVLILVVGLLPMTVFAADTLAGAEGSNLTWELTDGVLTISGTGAMKDYTSSSSKDVPWYASRNTITKVVFADGVTHIGAFSFFQHGNLESFEMADSVVSFGKGAFQGCSKLATIPELHANFEDFSTEVFVGTDISEFNVAAGNMNYTVKNGILYSKDETTLVNCPAGKVAEFDQAWLDGVTTIAPYAFRTCTKLTGSLVIPAHITSIGWQAFQNCSGLTGDLTLPDTVTNLEGRYAFAGMTGMTGKLTLGSRITEIADGMFNGSGFTSMEWQGAVTSVGSRAFTNCKFTDFSLPETVTTVGERAFQGCTANVNFGDLKNLSSIGQYAFADCTVGDVTIAKEATVGNNAFEDAKLGGVSYDAQTVASRAFWKATLDSLTLENNVNIIKKEAFRNSTIGGEKLKLGSVERIETYAFAEATLPATVIIPETATFYDNHVFYNAKGGKTLLMYGSYNMVPTALTYGSSFETVVIPADIVNNDDVTYGDNQKAHDRLTKMSNGHIIYMTNELSRKNAKLPNNNGSVGVTNGGTFAADTTFTAGTFATPVKSGYIFGGWYDNENFTGDAVTAPAAGKTYYAKWTQSTYSVEPRSVVFDELTYGAAPTAKEITVNAARIENPSITSVTDSDCFDVAISDMTVTITPKENLSVGTYSETMLVTTGDGATFTIDVTLTVNPADKTALSDAITEAETRNESDYTAESWDSFQAALADAKRVYDDPNQTEEAVAAAAEALTNAVNALVPKPVTPENPDHPDRPVILPPVISPVIPTMPGLPFKDVSGDAWYYDAIDYVYDTGLMKGVSATKFDPMASTTRGMIVTILYRMEGSPRVYSDRANWWSDARAWAMEYGVSDGTNMTANITREQLAAMLFRYAKLTGADVSARSSLSRFADSSAVSDWAKDAMQWAVAEGIIGGANGKLNPQGLATRAEVAAMFMRFNKSFG